jgi:hypothetical protein
VTDGGDRLREGAQVELPDATAADVAKARALAQAQRKNEPKFPNGGRRKNSKNGQGRPGGGYPGGGGYGGGGRP